MRKLRFGSSTIVAGCLVAFSAIDSAMALEEVLDQSHVLTHFESDAGPFGAVRDVAQTIRVGVTGQLTRLEFWGYNGSSDPNATGTASLDIRLTETDGSPVEDDSSALAQVLLSSAETSTLGPGNPPPITHLLVSIDLTQFNLFFNAGDYFTVNFSDPSPGENFGLHVLGDYGPGGSLGPYPIGQAFLRRTDIMNGEFYAWDGGSAQVGPVDLGFRTFMLVPEPSTFVLLGIGAISFFLRKKGGHH